jgi:molybdenum cofactor synthesis domain-containing protein
MDIATPATADGDDDRIWTAGLVIIGDEILSGRTQDANLSYLAKWLGVQGIRLKEVRVVADEMDAIGDAVKALSAAHDYLFTTGGIGPTHDDITVDAVAAALGLGVIVHPDAQAILAGYYGDKLTDARLRMARTPEGASLIHNPRTKAPGIRIGNVFIMAGVPMITQGMLAALDGKLPGGKPVQSRTVGAWTQESTVAATLLAVETAHPGAQIGSYPFWREGKTGANFVVRSTSVAQLAEVAVALIAALEAAGIAAVDGEI